MTVDLSRLPLPAEKRLAVRITPEAQRALRHGHPWVFDKAVRSVSPEGHAGDLAVIFDKFRRFMAVGLYDPESPIRVRVLQHETPAFIDRAFLRGRLLAAAARRSPLANSGTDGYRLVHGENDGLPGLVIDRYAATLVIKLYTRAWLPWLNTLLDALDDVQPFERVVLRLSRAAASDETRLYGLSDGSTLRGDAPVAPVEFHENSLLFAADVVRGQKTGFFLDQRDNRARIRSLARGCRVLNVFAYSGGFSVYAAAGGAPSVVSVDLSAAALADAELNFRLNRSIPAVAACRHQLIIGDALEVLADLGRTGARFDLVIVDPPAFAKRESEAAGALQSYARLTKLALAATRPGGTVALASCSSRVSAADFFATITDAAAAAKRPLREIERTGHAQDHPIGFPEGAYLKCLFAVAP
ncbi:MAG: class I SAM-dependent rRNA methyltransferase [Nitrososphaerales archaeon]